MCNLNFDKNYVKLFISSKNVFQNQKKIISCILASLRASSSFLDRNDRLKPTTCLADNLSSRPLVSIFINFIT